MVNESLVLFFISFSVPDDGFSSLGWLSVLLIPLDACIPEVLGSYVSTENSGFLVSLGYWHGGGYGMYVQLLRLQQGRGLTPTPFRSALVQSAARLPQLVDFYDLSLFRKLIESLVLANIAVDEDHGQGSPVPGFENTGYYLLVLDFLCPFYRVCKKGNKEGKRRKMPSAWDPAHSWCNSLVKVTWTFGI